MWMATSDGGDQDGSRASTVDTSGVLPRRPRRARRGGTAPTMEPTPSRAPRRYHPMSHRARIWLLALLTAAATSVATLLATAARAGIQGSGH
jgi:hypothetical protein